MKIPSSKLARQTKNIAGIYEISNNKIVAGVDYTISELITMTVVPSSNATTVMITNYLSNDQTLFGPNEWAKNWGSHVYNAMELRLRF